MLYGACTAMKFFRRRFSAVQASQTIEQFKPAFVSVSNYMRYKKSP